MENTKLSDNQKKMKSEQVDDLTQDDVVREFDTRKRIPTRYPLDESSMRRYYYMDPNSILQIYHKSM